MSSMMMDRYDFIKTVTAEGMPEAQAEAVACYVQKHATEILLTNKEEVVTKHYLDVKLSELQLDTKLAALKAEMLKWYVGTGMFQTVAMIGAIVALVKALR